MKAIIETLKKAIFNTEARSERTLTLRHNVYLKMKTASPKEEEKLESQFAKLSIELNRDIDKAQHLRQALVNVLLADGWDYESINTSSPELCC